MSTQGLPSADQQQPAQKQKFNVYTMMLLISFACIVTACVLLYLELKLYGPWPPWNTSEATVFNWGPTDSIQAASRMLTNHLG